MDDGVRVFDVSAPAVLSSSCGRGLTGCLLTQSCAAAAWKPEDPAGSNQSGLFKESKPEIQTEIFEERERGEEREQT